MDRPVASGFGRAWGREVLRSLVASAPLKTHEFNALAWLAYGGHRVRENAYAIRTAPDEFVPEWHSKDLTADRCCRMVLPLDLPCSWPEFRVRAGLFFRDRVHAHRLRRSRLTRQYTEPSNDE